VSSSPPLPLPIVKNLVMEDRYDGPLSMRELFHSLATQLACYLSMAVVLVRYMVGWLFI
jgi:hypothetical protein